MSPINDVQQYRQVAEKLTNFNTGKSKEHFYIKIDIKSTNPINASSKKEASSINEIALAINNEDLIKQILDKKQGPQKLEEFQKLFTNISQAFYVKHDTILAKLMRFFSTKSASDYESTKIVIESAKNSLQNAIEQSSKKETAPVDDATKNQAQIEFEKPENDKKPNAFPSSINAFPEPLHQEEDLSAQRRRALELGKELSLEQRRNNKNTLPEQIFNLGLKSQIGPAVEVLSKRYKGLNNVTAARDRAIYANDLINQMLFEKDNLTGIQTENEMDELIRICQNRNNFYHYTNLQFQGLCGQAKDKDDAIKEIQANIDLLNEPESKKVIALDDKTTCFAIPGGWIGHAVNYKIIKDGDEYFFEIHNKGNGVDDERLHGNLEFEDSTGKIYKKTTVRIKTTERALKDPLFLEQLFFNASRQDKEFSYDLICTHLLKDHRGEIVKSELENTLEDLFSKMNAEQDPVKSASINRQALELISQDSNKNFRSIQLYGTCVESNFATLESDMASSLVKKTLRTFTLADMTNKLGQEILSYSDTEFTFVSMLNQFAKIKLKKMKRRLQELREARDPSSINIEGIPLSEERKAAFIAEMAKTRQDLNFLPKIIRDDESILELAKGNVSALRYASKSLKADPKLAKTFVANNLEALKYFSSRLNLEEILTSKQKQRLIKGLKKGTYQLKDFPILQKDKDCVLAAIYGFTFSLEYAPVFHQDFEVISKAIKRNANIIKQDWFPENWKANQDIIKQCATQDLELLKFASSSLDIHDILSEQKYAELLEGLENGHYELEDYPILQKDKESIQAAIKSKSGLHNLEFASSSLKVDEILTKEQKDELIQGIIIGTYDYYQFPILEKDNMALAANNMAASKRPSKRLY